MVGGYFPYSPLETSYAGDHRPWHPLSWIRRKYSISSYYERTLSRNNSPKIPKLMSYEQYNRNVIYNIRPIENVPRLKKVNRTFYEWKTIGVSIWHSRTELIYSFWVLRSSLKWMWDQPMNCFTFLFCDNDLTSSYKVSWQRYINAV